MTTRLKDRMRELLTAGQDAVRAAEKRGSRRTVNAVYEALCALPLLDMSDEAYNLVQVAVREAAAAEDAETWAIVDDVEHFVSEYLHNPDSELAGETAIMTVASLAVHCSLSREGKLNGLERRAWMRAHQAGVEAIRAIAGAVDGTTDGRTLDKAMKQFLTAVRRAVPYVALYATRRALVEFARTYGFFVVGMRQPMPEDSEWEWMRRIGEAVYTFRVSVPGEDGFPYGAVIAQRVVEDDSRGPVRPFALTDRPASIAEARYLI